MTHPAPAIAGVVSLVAIVGVIGALRLSPDAGTEKLVDNGSRRLRGDAGVPRALRRRRDRRPRQGRISKRLLLTKQINRLLALEGCLAGNPGGRRTVRRRGLRADRRARRDAGRLRPGDLPQRGGGEDERRDPAAARGRCQAGNLSEEDFQQAAAADPAERPRRHPTCSAGVTINTTSFVQTIVFDIAQAGAPPKSKFGYLFPSEQGALISIRLKPDLSDDDPARGDRPDPRGDRRSRLRASRQSTYAVSGVPVVVEGLADEIGSQIIVLFAAALAVMALVLVAVFGPPLRLLPLFIALGAAGFAFGLLSLIGGTLTMASVAVLPVVIGLAVDYAIQLQARFREAAAQGRAPAGGRRHRGRPRRPGDRHGGARHLGRLPGAHAVADPDGPRVRDRARRGHLRRPRDLAHRRARRPLDGAAPARQRRPEGPGRRFGRRLRPPAAPPGAPAGAPRASSPVPALASPTPAGALSPPRSPAPGRVLVVATVLAVDRLGRRHRDEGGQRRPRARSRRSAGPAVGRRAAGRRPASPASST